MSDRATISVDEAAALLGISRSLAYEEARKGSIAGVSVIKAGRRFLIPRAPFERALGVAAEAIAPGSNGSGAPPAETDEGIGVVEIG